MPAPPAPTKQKRVPIGLPIAAVILLLLGIFAGPRITASFTDEQLARNALLSGIAFLMVFVSIILMGGTFGLYLWETNRGMSIEHARTVAVNTLVFFEIFYLFNSRYITAPVLNWPGITGNRYVLIAIGLLIIFQLCFTYLGFLQTLFGTTAIELYIWLRILLVSSTVLFLVEAEKAFVRRYERRIST